MASPGHDSRDRPRFATGAPARWLFRIAAGFAAAFVLAVLWLSMISFSERHAAERAGFVVRHAGTLIALTAGGTVLFGLAAMVVDRRAMTRAARAGNPPSEHAAIPPDRNPDPTDGPADDSAA